MTEDQFTLALAGVFDQGDWIARRTYASRPFATVDAVHATLLKTLADAPLSEKLAYLHTRTPVRGAVLDPDTGGAEVGEHASVGLDRLSQAEFEELERLNSEYNARFGFPFMLSLKRHTKDFIFSRFNRRVLNDLETEMVNAIAEIGYITRIRLGNVVIGPGMPATTGSLTTHVLDTVKGVPAAGVSIELYEVSSEGPILLTTALTNGDGRTDLPLISGQPLRIGVYELHFRVGSYFRGTTPDLLADPAFLDVVPIRFSISQPESHYHVPLLVSPWSYSTYRGS